MASVISQVVPIIETGTIDEYNALLKALRFKNDANYRIDRYLNKYCALTASLIAEVEAIKAGLLGYSSYEAYVSAKTAEEA